MIAAVIMSETLLSENNFAMKNGYKIDENQEILACAMGNITAACVGCCPVNGSISRTSMNEQYEGKTQAVSVAVTTINGSRIAMCNWIYRIPAGSDSDSDRNLGTDECSRTASGGALI